jgi:hypothetical protein
MTLVAIFGGDAELTNNNTFQIYFGRISELS